MTTYDLQMQSSRPLTQADIKELESWGLRLEASLGVASYRLRGESQASLADLLTLPFVDAVEPCSVEAKLDQGLANLIGTSPEAVTEGATTTTAPVDASGTVTVLVSIDTAMASDDIESELADLGQVLDSSPRRARLRLSPEALAELVQRTDILSAEVDPDVTTQNNVARVLTRVDATVTALGLDGSGEIVGVADSGLDTGDPATVLADFSGRVINIRASTVKDAPFAGTDSGGDLNNHGTHVCGSIAGDGSNSNGRITGMAPAAELTVLAMGPNTSTGLAVPSDLTTGIFSDAYGDGARIHSNSWGSNSNLGKYTAFSEDVDEFAWNNRDMLIVVAAGNSGSGASSVSAPGTAKNCLTVGASESVRPLPVSISRNPNLQDADFNPGTAPTNVPLSISGLDQQADDPDDIAGFSGRGPVNDTGDNRTKPDIVAPGSWILSCRSSISLADVGPDGLNHVGSIAGAYADDADGVFSHAEAVGRGRPGAPFFGTWNQNTPAAPAGSGASAGDNYFYDSGTSMATPITSGAIALLRQYLRERRGVTSPSSALLKAMIINGATVPAGASTAPNNTRGFGWLDLEEVCTPAPTGQQIFTDDPQLAVATGDIRNFSVGVATTAEPLQVTLVWTDRQGKGLQNKLYLRVIAPDASVIDGDISAFPNPTNNAQRVHIATPMAGTYTVQVHGTDVAFASPGISGVRQDFALAVSNGVGFSPEPVDVVQVVDHSGSMGFYGFMGPARERTKQLVDILRVNDRTGVVQFDDTADPVAPVTVIAGFADQDAIKTAVDTIVPGGSTSIGAGLELAVTNLASGGDPTHPQAIVLVSDGHENTAPWVGGGTTDSPPSWYTGPNMTEVLPTVPAATKVYTVSLGLASDEIMLQEIATARGGLFQSITSAADQAKLHEIYVHLQALSGGEEVLAADSDVIDGLTVGDGNSAAMPVGAAPSVSVNTALDMAQLATPRIPQRFLEPDWLRDLLDRWANRTKSATSVHEVAVDESVSSVAFVVSWHDPADPVDLWLHTPSLKVIKPSTTAVQTIKGSTYFVYRVDRPEPGTWQMRVRVPNDGRAGRPRAYTWGAHGTTPVGLRVRGPKSPVGRNKHELVAELVDPQNVARQVRLQGAVQVPRNSIDELVEKHRDELIDLPLPPKFDKRVDDEGRVRLVLLDLLRAAKGDRSIFSTKTDEVAFSGRGQKVARLTTPVGATTAVAVDATGRSVQGHRVTRVARLDIRT